MPFYTGETVTTGLTLFPHCAETYYLKDSAVGCDNPGLGGDPMSYFGVGYALMRGSVNISVETNEPDFRVLGYLSPERFTGSNLSTSSEHFQQLQRMLRLLLPRMLRCYHIMQIPPTLKTSLTSEFHFIVDVDL